jgi:TonB family protein
MISCSAVLSGYYYFFLRNRSFHVYNRFFVLLIFPFSIILPFVSIPFLDKTNQNDLPVLRNFSAEMLPEVIITPQPAFQGLAAYYIIGVLYLAVLLLFSFRIYGSVSYLFKISRQYPFMSLGKLKVFFTNEPGSPFSFFRWIFWSNKLDTESVEGRQVLQHELYHVKEKHAFDLLFTECILAFCWFNPFFFYLRKELKAIHEFLADQAAINGIDRSTYAELLLLHAISEKKYQLTHSFFQNHIKRRVIMLTEKNKTSFAYLRRLMCLPILFILCIACSRSIEKQQDTSNADNTEEQDLVNDQRLKLRDTIFVSSTDYEKILKLNASAKTFSITSDGEFAFVKLDDEKIVYALSKKELEAFQKDADRKQSKSEGEEDRTDYNQTFSKLQTQPSYPGGPEAWMRFLSKTFHYPDEAIEQELQGTVVVQFIVDKEGNLNDVTAVSGAELLKREAVRVIKASGKWNPGKQNGQNVKAYHKQPITFRLQAESEGEKERKDYDQTSSKLQTQPSYPGGVEAWMRFLNRTFHYPDEAVEQEVQGTVVVQFIVDTEGNVNDVTAISGPELLKPEAVRVIKASGKWNPAKQNGQNVKVYHKQPITFRLQAE